MRPAVLLCRSDVPQRPVHGVRHHAVRRHHLRPRRAVPQRPVLHRRRMLWHLLQCGGVLQRGPLLPERRRVCLRRQLLPRRDAVRPGLSDLLPRGRRSAGRRLLPVRAVGVRHLVLPGRDPMHRQHLLPVRGRVRQRVLSLRCPVLRDSVLHGHAHANRRLLPPGHHRLRQHGLLHRGAKLPKRPLLLGASVRHQLLRQRPDVRRFESVHQQLARVGRRRGRGIWRGLLRAQEAVTTRHRGNHRSGACADCSQMLGQPAAGRHPGPLVACSSSPAVFRDCQMCRNRTALLRYFDFVVPLTLSCMGHWQDGSLLLKMQGSPARSAPLCVCRGRPCEPIHPLYRFGYVWMLRSLVWLVWASC